MDTGQQVWGTDVRYAGVVASLLFSEACGGTARRN